MVSEPRQHLTLIIFSTILAGFSLASIINFTDPQSASWLTLSFFYFSLFLVSLGIFTLIGLGLRKKFWPGHSVANLSNSFRQALHNQIVIQRISFIFFPAFQRLVILVAGSNFNFIFSFCGSVFKFKNLVKTKWNPI